jgi:hypothetical protein
MSEFARRLALCAIALGSTATLAHAQTPESADTTSALALTGRARISAIYDLEVVGKYLYALENGVIRVMDARDPDNIKQIDSLVFALPRTRMHLRGSRMYLAGFGAPLGIVDVSIASKPRWIREDESLLPTAGRGFQIAGDVALMVRRVALEVASVRLSPMRGHLFLDVLDLTSTPDAPRSVATVDLDVSALGEYGAVTYDEGRAYVLVSRPLGSSPQSQLIVVDVRQHKHPKIERRFTFPSGNSFRNLEVRHGLLYLARSSSRGADTNGLVIYRLGDTQPEYLGEATSRAIQAPIDLALRGDVVYMTTKGIPTLVTFNVSNPRRPRIVQMHGDYDDLTAGLGMAIGADRLYVTGDNGPFSIFDIRVPDAPRFLARWPFHGGAAMEVLLTRSTAIVTGFPYLIFVDVSNPASAHRIGRHEAMPSYWLEPWQNSMAAGVSGSTVVVAYESKPAEIIDASVPAKPRVVSTFEPVGLPNAVAVSATHAFIGYTSGSEGRRPMVYDPSSQSEKGGIEVRDLRDANARRPAAVIETEHAVTDLALAGTRLVAAHRDGSISIYDVAQPAVPRFVGRMNGEFAGAKALRGTRVALSTDGAWAFVTRASARAGYNDADSLPGTLAIIDLSDASQPRVAAQRPLEGHGETEYPIMTNGKQLGVLLGYAGGLLILDVRDPRRPLTIAHQQLPPMHAAWGLALDEKHVYVGAGESGMLIYSLPKR